KRGCAQQAQAAPRAGPAQPPIFSQQGSKERQVNGEADDPQLDRDIEKQVVGMRTDVGVALLYRLRNTPLAFQVHLRPAESMAQERLLQGDAGPLAPSLQPR